MHEKENREEKWRRWKGRNAKRYFKFKVILQTGWIKRKKKHCAFGSTEILPRSQLCFTSLHAYHHSAVLFVLCNHPPQVDRFTVASIFTSRSWNFMNLTFPFSLYLAFVGRFLCKSLKLFITSILVSFRNWYQNVYEEKFSFRLFYS